MNTIPTYTMNVEPNELLIYVVSIGRRDTYISHRSTRRQYTTFDKQIASFKAMNERDAHKNDDEILEHRIVIASSRKQVVNALALHVTWGKR